MEIDREEIKAKGKDVLKTVKRLVRKGNVSRILVKDKNGKVLVNIPVTLGVIGAVWAPALAGFAFVFGLLKECSIEVENKKEK